MNTKIAGALLALCCTTGVAHAQNAYPTKPIRLIIPFAPGGGTDLTARAIALKLTEAWGQTVVPDNRAGANGTIAVDIATKSPPDGYTLTMISSSHSVNSSLYKNLPYDLTRDLAPITQATTQPYALVVHPSVAAKSVRELVALAKAKPDSMTYGSSGLGGLSHLSGALLCSIAGIQLVHVPYKGGAPALNDVVGGQIQMLFSTLLQSDTQRKAGRVRALAVTTKQRSPGAPDLPTMQEAGVPGYEVAGWYGVLAPAKTPRPIIDKLNKEMVRILHSPDVQGRLAADGSEAVGSTPEEFGAHIKFEVAKWAKSSGKPTSASIELIVTQKIFQRIFLALATGCALPLVSLAAALPDAFPNRPIRFIVPFVPGAGTDMTARAVAQKVGENIGQQVVVDNRAGAAGNIGMELAAKSAADGYTIVLVSASHTTNPALYKKPTYDLVRDFAPVSQMTAQPYCLTVHSSVPAKSIRELIDLAKAKPNTLTYGSSGTGGLSHLAGAMFAHMAKIEWIHVPYKGGAAAINDLLGGQINAQYTTIIGTIQHVKAGRMRWLAISTALRSKAAPDLPTIAEAGVPGFDVGGWYGVLAPAQTPPSVVAFLSSEVVKALKAPDVGERFAADGSEPIGRTPENFAAYIKSEIAKWAKVIKETGVRAE